MRTAPVPVAAAPCLFRRAVRWTTGYTGAQPVPHLTWILSPAKDFPVKQLADYLSLAVVLNYGREEHPGHRSKTGCQDGSRRRYTGDVMYLSFREQHDGRTCPIAALPAWRKASRNAEAEPG
jgi:hypothetical protein